MTVEIRLLQPADDRQAFRSGYEALDLRFHRYAGQNQFRHHIGRATWRSRREDPGPRHAEPRLNGRRGSPVRPQGAALPRAYGRRLAVDETARGLGLGKALLRFAIELAERMAGEVGCVGLVVDAKGAAEEFYRRYGFVRLEVVEGALPRRLYADVPGARALPAVRRQRRPGGGLPPGRGKRLSRSERQLRRELDVALRRAAQRARRVACSIEVIVATAALPIVRFGWANCGWLRTLNASKRNSVSTRPIFVFLMSDMSMLNCPGPRSVLRPASPRRCRWCRAPA